MLFLYIIIIYRKVSYLGQISATLSELNRYLQFLISTFINMFFYFPDLSFGFLCALYLLDVSLLFQFMCPGLSISMFLFSPCIQVFSCYCSLNCVDYHVFRNNLGWLLYSNLYLLSTKKYRLTLQRGGGGGIHP